MTVKSQVMQSLASLNGAKAILRAHTTQTQDQETVGVLQDSLEIIEQITRDLEKRIQILEYEEPHYKGY